MLSTPMSRLGLSCTCTECTTFLRPCPEPQYTTLLPHDLYFSVLLPPTPIFTPTLTPHSTAPQTPRLQPTLAPSPAFLSPRPSSAKPPSTPTKLALPFLTTILPPATSEQAQSLALHRVTLTTRSLWAQLSSPLDSPFPPLSAKTPGLAVCAAAGCEKKMMPGFGGRGVCGECEEAVRGAVARMGMEMSVLGNVGDEGVRIGEGSGADGATPISSPGDSEVIDTVADGKADCGDGKEAEEDAQEEGEGQEAREIRFALPSIPPSLHLLRTHSLHPRPIHSRAPSTSPEARSGSTQSAQTPLFALPNVSLDAEEYEEVTPIDRYNRDFPALPGSSSRPKTKSGTTDANSGYKWDSREFLTAGGSSLLSKLTSY